MALFSPKGKSITPEEYIDKYEIGNLENQEVIKKIAKDLTESKLTKEALSDKANVNLEVQVLYLETLVEQNRLILKQLEKLNNK